MNGFGQTLIRQLPVAQTGGLRSSPAMSIVPSDPIGTGKKISQYQEAPKTILSARAHRRIYTNLLAFLWSSIS